MVFITSWSLVVIATLLTTVNAYGYRPLDVVGCGRSSLPIFNATEDEQYADIRNHPWMALIVNQDKIPCPAVLIPIWNRNSSRIVLTSAKCQNQASIDSLEVIIGIGPDGRIHENYTTISKSAGSYWYRSKEADGAAFLFLKKDVKFNEFVRPVCLPRQSGPPPHTPCVLTGWEVQTYGNGSSGLQHAGLKETHLIGGSRKFGAYDGKARLKIRDTFNKTGVTHSTSSPLVCFHDGLWALYGIYLPSQSTENHSIFMGIYEKLHLIEDEIELPTRPGAMHVVMQFFKNFFG
ncbi:hypothetical protein M513_01545 [Trichuris suis]|uniref:Peptidase S1 domain-containing protein n=1 Tax=Trichuris suis TaxID=68888 RepID=A0A085MJP6_9BILA|nr:hypothetical protein M513_01545 [Trichuris suis]